MDRSPLHSPARALVRQLVAAKTPALAGSLWRREAPTQDLGTQGAEFGPLTESVLEVLAGLVRLDDGVQDRLSASRAAAASDPSEEGWGRVYGANAAAGQLSRVAGALLDEFVYAMPAAHLTLAGRSALAPGLRAVACAHLLRRDDWEAMVGVVVAAVGSVPYPSGHGLLRPVCPAGPVGYHLARVAAGDLRCPCWRPFPGLTAQGTDVALVLAETCDDWSKVLEMAPLVSRA